MGQAAQPLRVRFARTWLVCGRQGRRIAGQRVICEFSCLCGGCSQMALCVWSASREPRLADRVEIARILFVRISSACR